MYSYQLPEAQFEIQEAAIKLRELYPEIEVEFGYEEEVCRTAIFILGDTVLYGYTHSAFVRQGYMTTHLKSLLKSGRVRSMVVSVNNSYGQIIAAKLGMIPKSFYKPRLGDEIWSPYLHIRYVLEEPVGVHDKTAAIENALNPFLPAARQWVENSIVIEQMPGIIN